MIFWGDNFANKGLKSAFIFPQPYFFLYLCGKIKGNYGKSYRKGKRSKRAYGALHSLSKEFVSDTSVKYQASARHSRCLLELQSTLVTTYGLEYNEYSSDFQQVVTLEDLFKEA